MLLVKSDKTRLW